MNQPKITPLPWRIKDFKLAGCNIKSCEAESRTIAETQRPFPHLMTVEENKANAQFIVNACNSHDALVEALENLVANLEGVLPSDHQLEPARAALALAKGESK